MVSHELRAPIGVIESSLNAMRALGLNGSPDEQEKLIKVLDRGVQRLSSLVGDLMDITRIESGQLKLELEPVDAVELAGRVVEGFKGLSAGRGIELELDPPDGRCNLRCDPHRIEQVLTNLLDNALKFTDQGSVSVSVRCSPSDAIFSVTDSGPGIPTELHHKVFEKFFSLDPPTRDGKQGIGLGLTISRGIVEAHGGRMWVESGPGTGATFSFEIPRVPGP
jgi:signal transduction histidine kinase